MATPALLRHYGIDPSTIGAGTDLLTARTGNLSLVDVTTRGGEHATIKRVDLPSYTSAPSALVTESALRRHGWGEARSGWLIESKRPLTTEQIAAARSAAAVGRADDRDPFEPGRARDLADHRDDLVGALLALAIIAMTIGLIRGESASDLRTLTATGAASRTRRTLTASTAGALALLGVVLGVGRRLRSARRRATTPSSTSWCRCRSATSALLAVGLPRWRRAPGGSSPAASPGRSPARHWSDCPPEPEVPGTSGARLRSTDVEFR